MLSINLPRRNGKSEILVNFNTSNVINQHISNGISQSINIISIHLMLLINTTIASSTIAIAWFQYIKCYQSTEVYYIWRYTHWNFNTSNVINQLSISNWEKHQNIFQYIKCYQSTTNLLAHCFAFFSISIHQMLSINKF